MNERPHDPYEAVTEPVRRALEFLVLRGAASFAVAVFAVLVNVAAPAGPVHVLGHLALPGVLVFVVLARLLHVVTRREPWDGHAAWARAAAVDRAETATAAVVALVVTIAWAVGLGAILVHHVADSRELAEVLGIWLPAAGALWATASLAWAGDCRERLARALAESQRRFRAYWASIGRSA